MESFTTDLKPNMFWRKVDKSADCWQWTGSKTQDGYGRCRRNGIELRAHRVAFELVNGPIAKKQYIFHTCGNKACVNPEHMQLYDNAKTQICKRCGTSFSVSSYNDRKHCVKCNPTCGPIKQTPEERKRNKLDAQLRCRYGISVEDLESMQQSHGNKCAICKRLPPTSNKKRLSVDRCHQTGRIRGLLCTRCNSMLGWFELHKRSVEEYINDQDTH